MKVFWTVVTLSCLISFANADIVKHDGFLKSVNPSSGQMLFVNDFGRLVSSEEAEIISGNLVKYKGYLKTVDPTTGAMHTTREWNGRFVRSNEVS